MRAQDAIQAQVDIRKYASRVEEQVNLGQVMLPIQMYDTYIPPDPCAREAETDVTLPDRESRRVGGGR